MLKSPGKRSARKTCLLAELNYQPHEAAPPPPRPAGRANRLALGSHPRTSSWRKHTPDTVCHTTDMREPSKAAPDSPSQAPSGGCGSLTSDKSLPFSGVGSTGPYAEPLPHKKAHRSVATRRSLPRCAASVCSGGPPCGPTPPFHSSYSTTHTGHRARRVRPGSC